MPKTILVVDDDAVNLLAAKKYLQQEYKVIAINSGKTAIKYLQNHIPDLILLDIMMPEMDGFELMETLQANPEWKMIPVIFLTSDHSSDTESKCLKAGAMDFVIKPFVDIVLSSRIRHALELSEARKDLEHRIVQMQSGIITSVANLIESRDGTTGEHVKRTRGFVDFLLRKMCEKNIYAEQLTPKFISLLREAAPLHDIGKIVIPDKILQKPGIYTPEERLAMQKHAPAGGKLIRKNMHQLREKAFVDTAYIVATYHHERWNGSGYPEGLAGFDIPLEARIIAIADVFDALTSKRSYKEPISFEDALKIMFNGSGSDFEPCLIEAFLSNPEELKTKTQELHSSCCRRN